MKTLSNVQIGTSGWIFDDWAGVFYPMRVAKSKWLEYYSARFPIGELNSSYYGIPSLSSFKSMAERTPKEFGMFIKAHSEVTHERKRPKESLGELLDNAAPLKESGKLLGVLMQFPNSFHYTIEHWDYVRKMRDYCGGELACVEFRHASWERDDVHEQMNREDMVWVSADEPPLPGLMPPQVYRTRKFIYIRMHGRNSAAWYGHDGEERYNYHYSDGELKEWISKIEEKSGASEKVYVLFNNCRSGNAILNAVRLKQMIYGNEKRDDSGRPDEFILSSS